MPLFQLMCYPFVHSRPITVNEMNKHGPNYVRFGLILILQIYPTPVDAIRVDKEVYRRRKRYTPQ